MQGAMSACEELDEDDGVMEEERVVVLGEVIGAAWRGKMIARDGDA